MEIPRHSLEIAGLETEIKDLQRQLAEANKNFEARTRRDESVIKGLQNKAMIAIAQNYKFDQPDWKGLCDKAAELFHIEIHPDSAIEEWLKEYEGLCKGDF